MRDDDPDDLAERKVLSAIVAVLAFWLALVVVVRLIAWSMS